MAGFAQGISGERARLAYAVHNDRLGLLPLFFDELLGSFAGFLDLRLEDDVTFAGSESFRRCACADLFRPLGVFVVSVLI